MLLLLLLLLLDPAAIDYSTPDTVVNETDIVKLYCNSTGNPPPNITWTKDGWFHPMAIWGKLLLINVTGKSVEGTYRCNASNGVREQASATIKLTVQSRYPSIDTNVMSHDYDSSIIFHVNPQTVTGIN